MTKIEWTEKTWNPIVGCSIVSPGCTHCYAMRMAARLEAVARTGNERRTDPHHGGKTFDSPLSHYLGTTQPSKAGPVWTGKVALAPDRVISEPLRRKKPTMWFVNSMGDLFHEGVPDEWIDRVFAVMALTCDASQSAAPHHSYQILTKRSARMRAYITHQKRQAIIDDECDRLVSSIARDDHAQRIRCVGTGRSPFAGGIENWPLPNVWLGVSAERQQEADERIPDLLATPAAVRFVSAEPLLGPVDLTRVRKPDGDQINALRHASHLLVRSITFTLGDGTRFEHDDPSRIELDINQPSLDWVICGGESGPGARPMHPAWARSLRDQCAAADVPFFFKQWGAWLWSNDDVDFAAGEDWARRHSPGRTFEQHTSGHTAVCVGKARAGRLLDGRLHDDMPEVTR